MPPERKPGRGGRPPDRPAEISADVVYGRNPVRELVSAGRRGVQRVLALPDLAAEPWVAALGPSVAERAALGAAAGTGDHQGIVAYADPYPYADARDVLAGAGPVICLDRIQDPRNLGAIARVADGAGAAGIVVARRGSPGVTGAVCKTSAGAIEHVLLAQVENVASFLHDARGPDRWVVGADADGEEDYRAAGLDPSTILVLGAEGEGLRPRVRSMCDRTVRIPMSGRVASLNVSVAAALLLFETTRGR